jgi:hypothetical protein
MSRGLYECPACNSVVRLVKVKRPDSRAHTTPQLWLKVAKARCQASPIAITVEELRMPRKGMSRARYNEILRVCISIARELYTVHGWEHRELAAAFGRDTSAIGWWLRGEIKAEGSS